MLDAAVFPMHSHDPDIWYVCPLSLPEAKHMIVDTLHQRWQKLWDQDSNGRLTYQLLPVVPKKNKKSSTPTRELDRKLNRLRSHHTCLRGHFSKFGFPDHLDNICECLESIEDVSHFMLQCRLYEDHRLEMVQAIDQAFVSLDVPPHLRQINLKTLLGAQEDLPSDMRSIIAELVLNFISKTSKKI